MVVYAAGKLNLTFMTNVSYFCPQKTQISIRTLKHNSRPPNMILQSDRGMKVNTFKSHLNMLDLPKWMCSLRLIALL